MNREDVDDPPTLTEGRDQIQVVYFGPRPGGRALSDFRRRWRTHGRLAMGLPYWRFMARYEQLDVLDPADVGIVDATTCAATASGSTAFGGVGIIWFHDLATLSAAGADPGNDVMRVDELATFGAHLDDRLVPTTERRLLRSKASHDSASAAVDLVLKCGRGVEPSCMRLAVGVEGFVRQLQASPEVRQYVQSVIWYQPIDDVESCAGYLRIGFADEADAASFAVDSTTASLWADAGLPLEGEIDVVLTRSTVLFYEVAS